MRGEAPRAWKTAALGLMLALCASMAAPAEATDRPQDGGSDGDVPTLRAQRVAEAPILDGVLDETAWRTASVATDFTQMRPTPGDPSGQRTEARVIYTDEAVYIGMRLYDTDPDGVVAQMARRDASGIYSDWAHVLIDSYHDRRTAFRFSVNPRGVQKDVLHYDDFSEDVNWDGVWDVATRQDAQGWVAEFRIPLSQLRFSAKDGEGVVWGINFGREIARYNEWSWWAPVLPNVAGMVSVAGELRGIEELEPPRRLEVLPYVVAQGSQEPEAEGNPFQDGSGRDGRASVGGDLKLGLTSNLTLSATINPDFGQVEADPSVVNLTAQETYYPEKRPFFVEGSNIFSYNIGFDDGSGEGLFYTRRIGRSPQRSLRGQYSDVPTNTTILGAAKVSGRTAGGWSIGFLDALTAEEEGRVLGFDDQVATHTVEPMTNYSVARASKDFRDGRSGLGFMGTHTYRNLDGDESLLFLTDQAFTGGVDFRHRFAEDTWDLSGWFAGSHVTGDTLAIQRLQRSSLRYYQRPDADHLEYDPQATSLAGYGGTLNLWKVAGNWRGGVGGTMRSPGMEINDAGFQTAADLKIVYGNIRYHRFDPIGPFRNLSVGLNPSASWDFGNENAHSQINLFSNYELKNNWNFGFWSSRAFEGLSTGALRGGPAIKRPGAWRANLWLNTDSRKPVFGNVGGFWALDDEGAGWTRNTWVNVTFRPSGRLDLTAGPSFNERHTEWQYVAQRPDAAGDLHYVFAPLHQQTVVMTTRLSYAFTPTLSFQLYAQPFVSAGEYGAFREVTDPRADAFDDRFYTYSDAELAYVEPTQPGGWGTYEVDRDQDGTADFSFGEPEFNFKELRSTAVMRWEYRPGSTLFVVWSQGRSATHATGQFDPGADFDQLLDAAGTNVLAIKLSYWLDF